MIGPTQRLVSDKTQRLKETDNPVSGGIRTEIPARKLPQTHTLDRAATLIFIIYSGVLKLYALEDATR